VTRDPLPFISYFSLPRYFVQLPNRFPLTCSCLLDWPFPLPTGFTLALKRSGPCTIQSLTNAFFNKNSATSWGTCFLSIWWEPHSRINLFLPFPDFFESSFRTCWVSCPLTILLPFAHLTPGRGSFLPAPGRRRFSRGEVHLS